MLGPDADGPFRHVPSWRKWWGAADSQRFGDLAMRTRLLKGVVLVIAGALFIIAAASAGDFKWRALTGTPARYLTVKARLTGP